MVKNFDCAYCSNCNWFNCGRLIFYNYAVVPGKKDFINENTPGSKVVQTPEGAWFKDDKNRQEWSITSEDGLRLKAIYLPADKK